MFKRILVAFDGSSHAKRALVEAADLASATDGELTVISVVPELSSWILAGPVPPPANLTELQDQVADSYRQDLREAVEALPDQLRVSSKLLRGHAAAEILDQARAGNHDLLVVGSRGRSEVQSLLLGSVSEHVSRASRVPVLIVHGV
jgi:nucleotide-binding universal stress UspA family protein